MFADNQERKRKFEQEYRASMIEMKANNEAKKAGGSQTTIIGVKPIIEEGIASVMPLAGKKPKASVPLADSD